MDQLSSILASSFRSKPLHSVGSLLSFVGNEYTSEEIRTRLQVLVDHQVLESHMQDGIALYSLQDYSWYARQKMECYTLRKQLQTLQEKIKEDPDFAAKQTQLAALESNIEKARLKITMAKTQMKTTQQNSESSADSTSKLLQEIEELQQVCTRWRSICSEVFDTVRRDFSLSDEQCCALGGLPLEDLIKLGVEI
ncbi:hypothetical protein GEMRC1_010795 [Eukaryota sp. GEM-RC1]